MPLSLIELTDGRALVDKVVGTKTMKDEGGGELIALVSTESVDSDGDIIYQGKNEKGEGWNLKRFNKHPVMLWSHNIYLPSIGGGAAWVGESKIGTGLHFSPLFDKEDDFARQIEGKIDRGVITETSVGFTSKNFAPRKSDGPGFSGYEFFDSELVEISWVNRGANPDVDSMLKSMVKGNPGLLKELETRNDQLLEEMKAEFTSRLEEMESRMRSVENAMTQKDREQIEDMSDTVLENFRRMTE